MRPVLMRSAAHPILYAVVTAGALVALVAWLPAKDLVVELMNTVREHGRAGAAVFFAAYLAASLFGISRTALNVLAGILFEPVMAVTVVLVSAMVAFVCTFSIARYVAADWVRVQLEEFPVARKLMSAVEQNGFKLLLMMRMNPFVPGFINGYGFGLTSIRFGPYFGASILGAMPLILINVYLGWAGGMAMLRSGGEQTAVHYGILGFGVALSVVLLGLISWYGRRVMANTA